ncbi:MAG: NAD(P)H-dependent oxidoreductase subunit E [Anaerovoracaceae bacterium]
MTEIDIREIVENVLDKHKDDQLSIISILQDIQEELRYLPREAFEILSEELDMSMAKIYGVATFYENFSLTPKGKFIIKICDGTACHVRKSIPIIDAIKNKLDLYDDKTTTDDMLFTVETVSCLGACGLAPVLTVNDKVFPAMTPDKARDLVDELIDLAEKEIV